MIYRLIGLNWIEVRCVALAGLMVNARGGRILNYLFNFKSYQLIFFQIKTLSNYSIWNSLNFKLINRYDFPI